MFSIRTVLCPLDLRESSFITLAHAVKWAIFYGSELLIVHVIDFLRPSLEGEDVLFPDVEERSHRTLTETESKLQQLVERRGVHIPPTRLLIRFGDPATVIVDIARQEAVDLIILGICKSSDPGSFFADSTTNQLLRASCCAVLTVPLSPQESSAAYDARSVHLNYYAAR